MKLHTYTIADVGTEYLDESDLNLILEADAPNHLANLDGREGSFFYSPEISSGRFGEAARAKEAWDEYAAHCRDFGLSAKFLDIMQAAHQRGIPYIRFVADGGPISK